MCFQDLSTQQLSYILALVQWANLQVPEAQSNPRNLCSMGTTVVAQMPTDV